MRARAFLDYFYSMNKTKRFFNGGIVFGLTGEAWPTGDARSPQREKELERNVYAATRSTQATWRRRSESLSKTRY
jgi:hypothetical protein